MYFSSINYLTSTVFLQLHMCPGWNFCYFFFKVSCQDQIDSCPPLTKSVLLISEKNARHVVGVMRYLGRTNAPLPPELLSFAQGIHVAREDQKTNKPLCRYLKSFGVCRSAFKLFQTLMNWFIFLLMCNVVSWMSVFPLHKTSRQSMIQIQFNFLKLDAVPL